MSKGIGQPLLEELGRRGFCQTAEERLRLARVASAFSGSSEDFGDAVAALLATNPVEVEDIRRIVQAHIDPPAVTQRTTVPPGKSPVGRTLKRWVLLLAAALVIPLLPWAAAVWVGSSQPEPSPPVSPAPPPVDPSLPPQQTCSPVRPLQPEVPPQPVVNPLAVGGLVGVAILLALIGIWRGRAQAQVLRNGLRRRAAAQLPGPADYVVRRTKPPSLLADADRARVERDLRSAAGTAVPSDRLDVSATLESTLARGLVPTPVFQTSALEGRMLVLVDQSEHWQLWSDRFNSLLEALRASAPRHDLRFLDARSELVTSLDGTVNSLEQVAGRGAWQALLLVAERASLVEGSGEARSWLARLSQWPKRAWIDPLASSLTSGEHSNTLPRRFPATPTGVARAAAFMASGAVPPSLSAAASEREADANAGYKLDFLRLIAGENLDLAKEAYRRLFDADPEVAARTLRSARMSHTAWSAPRTRLRELFAAASGWVGVKPGAVGEATRTSEFRDARDLEERVRQVILDVLRESEPQTGSLAHLRWQRDVALQQLQSDDPMNRRLALHELRELAKSLPPEELALPDELDRWGLPGRPWTRERLEDRVAHLELSGFSKGVRGVGPTPAWFRFPWLTAVVLVLAVAFVASRLLGVDWMVAKEPVFVRNALLLEVVWLDNDRTRFKVLGVERSLSPIVLHEDGRRLVVVPEEANGYVVQMQGLVHGCFHAQATAGDGSVWLSNFVSVDRPPLPNDRAATLAVDCVDKQGRSIAEPYSVVPGPRARVTPGQCGVPLKVEPGKYTLTATLDGEKVSAPIELAAGTTQTVRLAPAVVVGTVGAVIVEVRTRTPKFDRPIVVGSFRLTSQSGDIFVGNEGKELALPPGAYELTFPSPDIASNSFKIRIAGGQTTKETLIVTSRDGLLIVKGDFPNVLIDGQKRTRERTSGGYRLPPKTVQVRADSESPSTPVQIKSGQTIAVEPTPPVKPGPSATPSGKGAAAPAENLSRCEPSSIVAVNINALPELDALCKQSAKNGMFRNVHFKSSKIEFTAWDKTTTVICGCAYRAEPKPVDTGQFPPAEEAKPQP